MIRYVGLAWALLAVASAAEDDADAKARSELRTVTRIRQERLTPEEWWAERTMREIIADHRRLIRREAEVAPDYRTEVSLIYLDRERAAGRDPFARRRERERQLSAARYEIDGLRYVTASDFRIGSETRHMAYRRGYVGYGDPRTRQIRRAENWSMNSEADLLWREQQRREAIIRRVMAVADRMEAQALAARPPPPRKPAWRRLYEFLFEPFRGRR